MDIIASHIKDGLFVLMLAPWMPVSTPHGDIVVSDLHKPQQLLSHSGETHLLICHHRPFILGNH